MNALLTAYLIMVPAPSADEVPTGSAPTLQYLKWNKGAFEMTVNVTEFVPVTESFAINVNGKAEVRTVTKYQTVTKTMKQMVEYKGVEVFTVDGKKVEESAWQKALGQGAVVVFANDGKLPEAAYRKLFNDGTLIVVAKPVPQPLQPANGPNDVPIPKLLPKR